MLNTTIWGVSNAFAGGIIYNCVFEILNYGSEMLTYKDSPFEMQNYLNLGFVLGFSAGIIRGYYGKPVLPYKYIT
tara:strand:- start:247 stop:471 length:225 start_codon:yes stop_codon:yes gene_type:complete